MNRTDPFEYPAERHQRRHGPRGYLDYRSFKPWLRDEFAFRCTYCLWRETWCADGDASFGVDHVFPQATHPDLICEYDNLIYACNHCNSLKQDGRLPVAPCAEGWGRHLQPVPSGVVRALTPYGERIIQTCRLNRPTLVEARARMMRLMETLAATDGDDVQALLRSYLRFPTNLPALSELSPPNGNSRPGGIAASFFELRKRGELPEIYGT